MGCVFSVEEQRKVMYARRNMMDSSVYYSQKAIDSHILTYVLEGEWNIKIGTKSCGQKKTVFFYGQQKYHLKQ